MALLRFLLIAAIVALAAPEARAFCRAISQDIPPSYNPAVSGCFMGSGGPAYPLYWANLCVSYSLQKNASVQIPLETARGVAQQAFAAWNQVPCGDGGTASITASEMEPPDADGVDCDEVQYNKWGPNQHVIVFRDDGWPDQGDSVNTLGLTTMTFDITDGEIFDADTEINSSDGVELVAGPPAPAGTYDLLTILTHEAGHFLGLAHSADETAMMYAFYQNGGASTLQPDDIEGICSIDSPDGMRSTFSGAIQGSACCPIPRHGFTSECAPEDDAGNVIEALAASPVPVPTCSTDSTDEQSSKSGCSASPARPTASGMGAFGFLMTLGLLARRRRGGLPTPRRMHRRTGAATWLGFPVLAVLLALLVRADEARASVAIAVSFEDLLSRSEGAAVVVPIEARTAWEGGRIYTRTRLRVDNPIAGHLPGEAWVRTRGGVVGTEGQIVEGEASFQVGEATLVFLRSRLDPVSHAATGDYVVVERAQGQFGLVAGADQKLRLAQGHVGLVLPPSVSRAAAPGAQGRGPAPRLAHETLIGLSVEQAVGQIVAAWPALHGG
ncbi:MAG: matrixin family metalloprotease [Polyangiaceae bacterium]|jgi:hypothetical protein